jgi:hypothetical protein
MEMVMRPKEMIEATLAQWLIVRHAPSPDSILELRLAAKRRTKSGAPFFSRARHSL